MNKINISDSDKRLLLIFFAVLIFAGAYFFIFNPNMKKAAEIAAENDSDKAAVEQLQMMEAQLPAIKEQIIDLKEKQEAIIERYPSDLTTEKIIWVLQDIQTHNDFQVTEASFLMNNQLGAVETESVDAATDESADAASTDTSTETVEAPEDSTGQADAAAETSEDSTGQADTPAGYYATVSISYEASYKGLKDMIAYVNAYPDRITITQSDSQFDKETGKLVGSMILNMYYITNSGKDYVKPDFGSSTKGVENIFGSTTAAVTDSKETDDTVDTDTDNDNTDSAAVDSGNDDADSEDTDSVTEKTAGSISNNSDNKKKSN